MEEIKCECLETKRCPLVLKEKRSQIRIESRLDILFDKIKVDGCQITDDRSRCDYLLIQKDNGKEYFVELKGTNINHAIQQIEATIPRLSKNPKRQNKLCFVIATEVSPKFNTQKQNLQKSFRMKYNAQLIIKSTPYTHTI